jgi:hypothetical protein
MRMAQQLTALHTYPTISTVSLSRTDTTARPSVTQRHWQLPQSNPAGEPSSMPSDTRPPNSRDLAPSGRSRASAWLDAGEKKCLQRPDGARNAVCGLQGGAGTGYPVAVHVEAVGTISSAACRVGGLDIIVPRTACIAFTVYGIWKSGSFDQPYCTVA